MKNSLIMTTIALAIPVAAMATPMLLPVAPAMPAVKVATVKASSSNKALSIYRQVRSFWLSRAIVR